MAANEIHVDDLTTFRVTLVDDGTAVNVSAATTKQLKFQGPDGTSYTKTASFYTDGSDGIIQWTATDGFLTVGNWLMQAYIVMSGWTGHSDIHKFTVYANL